MDNLTESGRAEPGTKEAFMDNLHTIPASLSHISNFLGRDIFDVAIATPQISFGRKFGIWAKSTGNIYKLSMKPPQGSGEFFRIEVNPKEQFVTFRNQDVGRSGHIERLAGQRADGSWDTYTWLVSKQDAYVEGNKLVPDSEDAKELFRKQLRSEPVRVKGDIFEAQGIPSVYEH